MDAQRRGKLLLVEDENLLRRLIAEFLRGEGFEVVEAADGLQGAGHFSGYGPFDIVLLDLNLPLLSGVDVCRRIKSQQPLQPVLICSAAILDSHVSALQALNVDQFLTKPYHPLDLLERIARAMSRSARLEDNEVGPAIPGALCRVAAHPRHFPAWRKTNPEESMSIHAAAPCP
jgi:DNA-binding response OmpR family regulator